MEEEILEILKEYVGLPNIEVVRNSIIEELTELQEEL